MLLSDILNDLADWLDGRADDLFVAGFPVQSQLHYAKTAEIRTLAKRVEGCVVVPAVLAEFPRHGMWRSHVEASVIEDAPTKATALEAAQRRLLPLTADKPAQSNSLD